MACKNSKTKKGQAALEFLTTYGWAFMVILVMIGALAYFGVLNPSNLIPSQCTVTSGFSCKSTFVNGSIIGIELTHSMGESVALDTSSLELTLKAEDVGCTTSGFYTDEDLTIAVIGNVAEGSVFYIGCAHSNSQLEEGQTIKIEYKYTYRRVSGSFQQPIAGTLTTRVQ